MRYAAPILVLAAVAACEGRSPVEPSRARLTASVVGRVQDAVTGDLVPCRVELTRSAQPGASIILTTPTGEWSTIVVPATWQIRATAERYLPTLTELAVTHNTSITIGIRRDYVR